MLVTRNPQPTLWEAILPPGYQDLPVELARVDALLDDEAFFAPYRAHFSELWGRPSIPIETYLRMMFLKHRYQLGYETLCREVADSLTWMRFCRIPLGARVPHPSTLGKLTVRCGPATVEALNQALLGKAVAAKVVKTDQVRVDTTVVPADVTYPTDSGLLAKAITLIIAVVARIHAVGAASRTTVRDRRRASGRRARSISAHLKLRNDEAKAAVLRITGELAGLAEATAADAARVLTNARRHLRTHPTNGLPALIERLDTVLDRTAHVVAQTRTRLAGTTPDSATRLVSLHDPDARPIRKGRLGKPVEFGYKTQVADNRDGIVLDHTVEQGNPPDAPQLAPAVGRIKTLLGRVPRAVTTDRGYGEAGIDKQITDLGVKNVVIPRKGKPSEARRATEHSRPFRRLVKWRTGSERRVAQLKRRYGWDRAMLDGLDGAKTWCGLGVLAHNSVKIAALMAAKTGPATTKTAPPPRHSSSPRRNSGPPGQPPPTPKDTAA